MSLKKIIILILALIVSGMPGIYKVSSAQNNSKSDSETKKTINNHLSKLKSNPNWIKLSKLWKELNTIKAEKSFDVNKKNFDQMMAQKLKVEENLNGLVNAKLLKTEDKKFLQDLFNERFEMLKFRLAVIPCYAPIPPGIDDPASAGMDLEQRYKTIEKLASENKINSETYKTTINQIDKDLKTIHIETDKKNITQFVDLLYYLSK